MGVLNNEGLDDPLVFDAMPDFSGGMASNRPASALEMAQFFCGVNVDIKTKLAVTRRGAASVGAPAAGNRVQGVQWYGTPAAEYLMAVAGAGLWKYDEVTWTAVAGYSAAGGGGVQVGMAQIVDKLYIADATTNLHSWDGTTLVDLGSGTADKPPQGNIVMAHVSRLWCAGSPTVPDQLSVSQALVGAWNQTFLSVRIGSGDGDAITGLAPLDENQVVVFKRNSIYILAVDTAQLTAADAAHSLGAAAISKISDVVGCVSARSVAVVGADVWFLSDSGVRSLRRVIAQNAREVSAAISEPVADVVERMNWSVASGCAAAYWDNKYLLSLPLDAATEPDGVLVYDTLRQAWAGLWTGWAPLCWALTKAGNAERLNFGLPGGEIWRWLDFVPVASEGVETFQDVGAPIPTEVQTRGFVFGDGFSDKSLFAVETTFYQSQAEAEVAVIFEQGTEMRLETGVDTRGGIPLVLPFVLPATIGSDQVKRRKWPGRQFNRFREMQVVVRTTQSKLAVRAITAAAFPETVTPED